jgi:hypothetical protein
MMQLIPEWSFEEALDFISERYCPGGITTGPQRNQQIAAWGQLVGRTRALAEFDLAINQNGSFTKFGKKHRISVCKLRELRDFFENLPDDLLGHEQKIIRQLRKDKKEWKTVDAKRELILKEVGDKAEFVKDIIAMANNGEPSYLIIGLEDGTFTDVGKLSFHYSTNDINQILVDKIDPPIVVDYKEFVIDENEYAIIEINGKNPPYIAARDLIHNRTDRKKVRVYRGTIFVRHADRTEGISRAELEEILKIHHDSKKSKNI